MLQSIKRRFEKDEDGFTLIELMVVVLIIAILLAIAIPTFLGARERANERAAQSSLRNAHTAAKVLYTDAQSYTGVNATALKGVEPSLTFDVTPSVDFKQVASAPSQTNTAGDTWSAAAMAKNGKCFWIKEIASGTGAGTFYGSTTVAASCTGAAASGAALTGW